MSEPTGAASPGVSVFSRSRNTWSSRVSRKARSAFSIRMVGRMLVVFHTRMTAFHNS